MYRRYLFSLFVFAVFALVAGLLIVGVATFVLGNGWRRAIEPWFDYGMWLVLIGALVVEVSGFVYVVVSKAPAAIFFAAIALAATALAWFVYVEVGVPTVGLFGAVVHDPLLIVGSMPVAAAFWLGLPTVAIVVIVWLVRRVPATLRT